MSALLAAGEHVLALAMRKAIVAIREGRLEDAERVLSVAVAAADLLETEREPLR